MRKSLKIIFKPYPILIILIAVHLLLLSFLKFYPYPELFLYPFLAKNGLLPYKQIFDQHFPSVLMFPFNIYDLGLRSPESAKLFLYGTVALTQVVMFKIAKRLSGKVGIALLACFLYLVAQPLFEGYILWI